MDRHEDTKTRRKGSLFLIWCFRGVTARRTPRSLFVASYLRGLPILALLAISCSAPKPPDDRDYATRIAADRAAKDEAFMASDDPIPKAKHAEFLPLAYYPVDPE